LLCILTLAGAADDILGQYATRTGEKTMLDLLCSSLKKEHSINMTDKTFKWEYLEPLAEIKNF